MKRPIIPPKAILFLIGPTGVGKSAAAMSVARRLHGEIVSADSMQIYRGMDIGTGKPSRLEQRRIRHHLLDLCKPAQNFSVHNYYRRAMKAVEEIHARGRLPVVVGGSGLYIRALLQGLEERPAPDFRLRKKLEAQRLRSGVAALVKRLQQAAPEVAAKIDCANARRVIRALEVQILNKKRKNFSKAAPSLSVSQRGFTPVVIGMRREREVLYRMIERRIDKMFRQGWVREVQKLSRSRISRTAKQALGYRHLLNAVKCGGTLDRTGMKVLKETVKKETRRFAKRQMTWFRREENLIWVDCLPGMRSAALADQICAIFEAQTSGHPPLK